MSPLRLLHVFSPAASDWGVHDLDTNGMVATIKVGQLCQMVGVRGSFSCQVASTPFHHLGVRCLGLCDPGR